mmetsp:Transcript_1124/g.1865  ORF Transcript_1124/g.1865 Transcript_1124/m.1865 type:complete len:96 (+) Transcript_1124:122-409(+)
MAGASSLTSRNLIITGAAVAGIWALFPGMFRSSAKALATGARAISGASETGVRVCYITVPNAEAADTLAGKLVGHEEELQDILQISILSFASCTG